MVSKSNLYSNIVKLSEEFLGPAGERFIRRQVETHLGIRPEDIKPKHLPQLVDWTRLMLAVITEDTRVVDDFANRLLKLSGNHTSQTPTSNIRR